MMTRTMIIFDFKHHKKKQMREWRKLYFHLREVEAQCES